jgi:microcystin-dependent protein
MNATTRRTLVLLVLLCLIPITLPAGTARAQQVAKEWVSIDVLEGTIIMWSGPIASIPTGWLLCDGTQGTPDLTDRFVLGVQAGQDPGDTGGEQFPTLSKANMPQHDHSFTTDVEPDHKHYFDDLIWPWATYWHLSYYSDPIGVEDFYTNSRNTSTEGAHPHDGSALAAGSSTPFDNRPAYYRLAFIMKSGERGGRRLPFRSIVLWSDPLQTIPAGWQLCDGTAGTPDLSDRFLLSVTQGEDPGETGGTHQLSLTEPNLPAHDHDFTTDLAGYHKHKLYETYRKITPAYHGGFGWMDLKISDVETKEDVLASSDHTHGGSTDDSGSSTPFDNRPAFAETACITRIGPGTGPWIPQRIIALWTGSVASIPPGWLLCDGTHGRPDLRDCFVKSPLAGHDPGGTGGAHEAALTLQNLAAHDHSLSIDPAGSHHHDYMDEHGNDYDFYDAGGPFYGNYAYSPNTTERKRTEGAGAHSHTGTTDLQGSSAPFDNRPAFYRVAFIIRD